MAELTIILKAREILRFLTRLATKSDLRELKDTIMANSAELADKLTQLGVQLAKIRAEQTDRAARLMAAIKTLQDQIDAGNVNQAVLDAFDAVKTVADEFDADIDDATPA